MIRAQNVCIFVPWMHDLVNKVDETQVTAPLDHYLNHAFCRTF